MNNLNNLSSSGMFLILYLEYNTVIIITSYPMSVEVIHDVQGVGNTTNPP